jgi:polyisoprenoid-binding protein YceI
MTASATTTPVRTTWKIDSTHSQVEFAVKHLMIATVRGRFADVQGTVTADEDLTDASVDVAINVASIDTRQEQRDAHLRSADFFEVDRYPTITFKSRRSKPGLNDSVQLFGDLTIHGVSKEVTLTVVPEGRGKDPWGGERAGFNATTKINRHDFGLTWNQVLETGGIAVGTEVKISIDLELVRA